MQYIQACLLTKQNFFWCFDAGLEHMTARSRGNGTNSDRLRKSYDVSTCDSRPDGNPEKYGRPMKSAIQMWIDRYSFESSATTTYFQYILYLNNSNQSA